MSILHLGVRATLDRSDSRREFIIRLSPASQALVGVIPGDYVVVEGMRRVPGTEPPMTFRTIASVRGFSPNDPPIPREEADRICMMDMTLRDGIGVDPNREHQVSVQALGRTLRPNILRWFVQHQWMVCRVQKGFAGDMEMPVCRMEASSIENIGISGAGLLCLEAPHGRAVRRVFPLAQWHHDIVRARKDVVLAEDTPNSEIHTYGDFDGYLGIPLGRDVPNVHIDYDTRKLLDIQQGQLVWVRRDLRATLSEHLNRYGIAVALAVVGAALALPPGWNAGVAFLGVFLLLWMAGREMNNAVRASN